MRHNGIILSDAKRKLRRALALGRSLAGLKPGHHTGKRKAAGLRGLRPALQETEDLLYEEEATKKDSRASITAGTVVFCAFTMLRMPASRSAVAVTGPTATTAVLRDKSEMERRTWPPLPSSQLRKLWTAEGLKNRMASRLR